MPKALALVSAIALALLAAGQARKPSIPTKKGVTTMPNGQNAAAALEKLTDAALLHGDASEVVQRAYALLAGIQWEGVALRAPAVADTAKDTAFPVLVAFSQSSARGRQVVAGKSAIVVVTRVDGAGRWMVPVFPPSLIKVPEAEEPGAADVPIDDGSTGMTAVERLDLKEHETLPWEGGRYAVRALIYDWVSNTARVTLTGPPAAHPPAAAARPAEPPGNVNDPTVFPNFIKSKYSPGPPAAGVVLRVPALPIGKGKPVPVFGSARVAAPHANVVEASILLVRRNVLSPIVLDLTIPVFGQDRRVPGQMTNLYFAYDLNAVASAPLPAGGYQVYLVAGADTAGPYPLTVE
jgi:hypothetical protein